MAEGARRRAPLGAARPHARAGAAGPRPRCGPGRRRPRLSSRWPRRTPRPGTPTTSRPCWPSSPPTPWCASAGGRCRRPCGTPATRRWCATYLDGSRQRRRYDPSGLVWVTGQQQIAAWAAARFAQHHRFAVGPHRAAGDTVGWPYREFVDPFQLAPGVGPARGRRGGGGARRPDHAAQLVLSPASVQRQRGEVDAAFARAVATRRAAPLGDGPSVPLSGPPRAGPPAEPAAVGWPLALGGLALLGAIVVARRRRRRPWGGLAGASAGGGRLPRDDGTSCPAGAGRRYWPHDGGAATTTISVSAELAAEGRPPGATLPAGGAGAPRRRRGSRPAAAWPPGRTRP